MKLRHFDEERAERNVAPHTGAWIEIRTTRRTAGICRVAPHTGGVD